MGSDGLSEHPSSALLSCRASVPLGAKPCPGCPSISPMLDAAGALPPLGLGTLSDGWCFDHLGVLGLRETWGTTHSTCAIYSRLGTSHFKLRNYLVKESLEAVLGDVGWYDLLRQVKERNWSKSCLETQISDLPASGKRRSSCHTREDPDLPAPWVQERPAGPYPYRAPVAHTHRGPYQDRRLRGSHGLSTSTTYLSPVP